MQTYLQMTIIHKRAMYGIQPKEGNNTTGANLILLDVTTKHVVQSKAS